MSLHNEIKAHAKLVAKDVKAGKASAHSRRARDFMDDAPDAVLGVINLVHRAANRKKSVSKKPPSTRPLPLVSLKSDGRHE